MKEITVEEILRYSGKIELESYSLYSDKASQITDPEVKELAGELASEEMEHYNRINQLLEGAKVSDEDLKSKIMLAPAHYETLVVSRALPDNPTAKELLKVAYERELNTKAAYQALAIVTDLTEEMVRVFEELMNQEEGHALRIRNLMKKY